MVDINSIIEGNVKFRDKKKVNTAIYYFMNYFIFLYFSSFSYLIWLCIFFLFEIRIARKSHKYIPLKVTLTLT